MTTLLIIALVLLSIAFFIDILGADHEEKLVCAFNALPVAFAIVVLSIVLGG